MSDDELWKIKDTDLEAWAAGRLARAQSIYAEGLKRVAETQPPPNQKFAPGVFVFISINLDEGMSHFKNNRPARVEHTYGHAYGGRDVNSYSLLVRYDNGKWAKVSWYYEHQLTEITDAKVIEEYKIEIDKMNQLKEEIERKEPK